MNSIACSTNVVSYCCIAVLCVFNYCALPYILFCTVVWTVMSEIMPNRLRTKAVSLFISVNWGCNLIIGLLTLTAIDGLGGVKSNMSDSDKSAAEKNGVAYVYFVFTGFTVLGLVFIHLLVPETKGNLLFVAILLHFILQFLGILLNLPLFLCSQISRRFFE